MLAQKWLQDPNVYKIKYYVLKTINTTHEHLQISRLEMTCTILKYISGVKAILLGDQNMEIALQTWEVLRAVILCIRHSRLNLAYRQAKLCIDNQSLNWQIEWETCNCEVCYKTESQPN